MQPGFDGADRRTRKFFYFGEFVTFRIVQQHDDPLFLAELRQRRVENPEFLDTFIVGDWIEIARQVRYTMSSLIRAKTDLSFCRTIALPSKAKLP